MQHKNANLMQGIVDFVDSEYRTKCRTPSMSEIAEKLNMTKSCVSQYVAEMVEKGMIVNKGGSRGLITPTMRKTKNDVLHLPLVGNVACGSPLFAEENIECYIPIPKQFLSSGEHFILRANGESMINAGISNGDLVIIRKQETAEEGQIIVALINDEATLKRYYIDNVKKKIRLHPENDNMKDMYFKSIIIQGVAEKVIKDLV